MTPNKEDYLKSIYEIGIQTDKITNKEIAQWMQVSPPAVTEMIKKLIADEVILKDKKTGYRLTPKGLLDVSDLYRKHRLIEVFLAQKLHYNIDEVHEEAEILEHTLSERFVDRLEALLDFPAVCPHGGAIPKKDQVLTEIHTQRLADITEPGSYRLQRVQDNFELLKYLEKIQLTIGDRLEFIGYDSFTDLYQIAYKETQLQINSVIAKQLYIEKT